MRSVQTHAIRILLSLYFLEGSLALLLAGAYKASVSGGTFLMTRAGAALVAGGIGVLASAGMLLAQIKASGPQRRRALALGLTTNLLEVLLAFVVAEVTVRVVARRYREGIRVGSIAVRPTWDELIARNHDAVTNSGAWNIWEAPDSLYFVFDNGLGWTVGSNRQSHDVFAFVGIASEMSMGS